MLYSIYANSCLKMDNITVAIISVYVRMLRGGGERCDEAIELTEKEEKVRRVKEDMALKVVKY